MMLQKLGFEHLDALVELEKLCYTAPWSRALFEAELAGDSNFYLVALLDGQLVGCGGLQVVLDEGHVTTVETHPDYRRRGIARQLLRGLMGEARRRALSSLTLEVRVGNLAAQELYRSEGFRPLGVRPRYYFQPVEDALIMTRELSP